MDRPSIVSLAIGLTGLVAAAVMAVIVATDDDVGFVATEAGFVVEPAGRVGPDAFTPSVEVDDPTVCDTARFVAELTARPEAVREWSRVLGIAESEVPAYVATLRPTVLTEATAVTNHGLRNGSAYARPSVLESGTAVLMGSLPEVGGSTSVPPPDTVPSTSLPPTTLVTTPSTTTVGDEIPVTRCRCGNPLLPPYAPADGETPPASTTTTTVETTVPESPDQPVTPGTDEPSQSPPTVSTPTVPLPTEPSVPEPEPAPSPDGQDPSPSPD